MRGCCMVRVAHSWASDTLWFVTPVIYTDVESPEACINTSAPIHGLFKQAETAAQY